MDEVDMCTLPTAERPLRVAEFEELFAGSVRAAKRVEPGLLRLEMAASPEVAGRAATLVAKETACCSFFTFTLRMTGGEMRLDIGVPERQVAVLDALAVRAGA